MNEHTYIYLVRHAEQLKLKNNVEDSQIANEKIILSVNGERQAKELANMSEMQNIDLLWSSNYTRALATAKYIAEKNNIQINVTCNLGERKLGSLEELKILGENKKNSYTTDQMLDENLKTLDGESRKDVTKRMEKVLNKVLNENRGKRIVLLSHGAAIKFLLMKWCKLNEENILEYNNRKIILNSPGVIKLTCSDSEIMDIQQII